MQIAIYELINYKMDELFNYSDRCITFNDKCKLLVQSIINNECLCPYHNINVDILPISRDDDGYKIGNMIELEIMTHSDSKELILFANICEKVDKLFDNYVTTSILDLGEYNKYERGYIIISKSWLPFPKNIVKKLGITNQKPTYNQIYDEMVQKSRTISFN